MTKTNAFLGAGMAAFALLSFYFFNQMEGMPKPTPSFTKTPSCEGPSARDNPGVRHYAVYDFEAQRKVQDWVKNKADTRYVRLILRAEAEGAAWGCRVYIPDCLCNYHKDSDRSYVGSAAFFPAGEEGAFVFLLSRKQCEVIGEGPFIVSVAPWQDDPKAVGRVVVTDIRIEVGE